MGNERNLIRKRKNFFRVNAASVAILIKEIQEECYSQQELAEKCGLTIQTVRLYLKHLYKAGAIHIADWAEDKRGVRTLRVYGMGSKKDVPKPKRMTSVESCRKYREKKKMMKILNALARDIT
jgi:predicted ArsR family transcriptional regulator